VQFLRGRRVSSPESKGIEMRVFFFFVCVFAPAVVLAQQGGKQPTTSVFGSVLPMMLIMFGIIYFLMIRPEQKKQKERQKMIGEMKKGDKVLTAGGIYGVVASVKGDVVNLKIADNTSVEVTKTAISGVMTKETVSKNGKETK
jgi:preprotein translocase subunit YajC